MGDLSPHFNRREFDCHDGQIGHPTKQLVAALERLRASTGGKPLKIVSGYRDPAYNASVGGALNSQHMFNRAADIEPGYATIAQAKAAGFTGIGHDRSNRVVHVDVRPGQLELFLDV